MISLTSRRFYCSRWPGKLSQSRASSAPRHCEPSTAGQRDRTGRVTQIPQHIPGLLRQAADKSYELEGFSKLGLRFASGLLTGATRVDSENISYVHFLQGILRRSISHGLGLGLKTKMLSWQRRSRYQKASAKPVTGVVSAADQQNEVLAVSAAVPSAGAERDFRSGLQGTVIRCSLRRTFLFRQRLCGSFQ